MRYRQMLTLMLVALFGLGFMITQPEDASAQKRGGTLTYMIPASGAPSLDAHKETTYATIHPTAQFYSLLIRLDPTDPEGKRIAGDLAESWEASKDKKTFTFHLHKGVKFHDGSPLTAKDVVASFNKIIFPPEGVLSPRKAYFMMVDSIEAPDDYTVVFHLKFYSAAFIPAMAMPYNYIYPEAKLKQDIHWFEQNVLGSGPFKFVEYVPGSKIVGTRNDNYFKPGLPYLDGTEGVFSPKQNVQVQAIRGGRAYSMFRGLPPAARDDLVRALGDKVTVQNSTWNCILLATINAHKKPFDDVRVRRALNLAIDRWGGAQYLSRIAIVKTVGGVVFPGHDLAPSNKQLESLEGYGRDMKANRQKARELLREAGVPQGFKFTLHNRNTDQPYKIVGTWLVDQWRQVGLNVDQWVQPTAAFYNTLRKKPVPDFDVSMDFNCQSIVNPTLDIAKFLSWDVSPSNNGAYIDRELDKLYEEQLRASDEATQKSLLWDFQKRFSDQQWTLPTLWWNRTIVSRSEMKGWNITPSHYLNMQFETVWLDK